MRKRILSLFVCLTMLSGCGYHFSKNTGINPEDAGGFDGGPKSELAKVEDFIKGGAEEDLEELAKIFDAENVNTKTFTHEEYGEGVTALMLAVLHLDNIEPARFFMNLGADPDLTDASGKTAFDYIYMAADSIAEIHTPPVAHDEVPGFQDMIDLISVLSEEELNQKLIELILEDDRDAIRATIEEGADPSHFTADGMTPLMKAVQVKSINSMKVLLSFVDSGVIDKDQESSSGETVFGLALRLWESETDRRQKRAALNTLRELNCHFDANYKDPDRGRGCRGRR